MIFYNELSDIIIKINIKWMEKKSNNWFNNKNQISIENCTFKQTVCSKGEVLKPFLLMNKDEK